MRFKELERIIKKDGWYFDSSNGSHMHYKHPEKKGKITIPNHPGDLDPKTVKSVLRMTGLQ
ncbi:type II toxin-antitoxin system HicA family toxin [uncultured Selenomonas sp.]|uniref:type II toxin-antitoxin system HicA family toxin n=1 Tax=uncultured Selenomonas sp. TaxID=159275 RepID=UPI0028DC7217|nr:type II toxin-antitoxin system HicA family toxin [uncultured Selenomonas sp.]